MGKVGTTSTAAAAAVAAPLAIFSFALLFASASTSETTVQPPEVTTVKPVDSAIEARRHSAVKNPKPKPSATAYYPYPYQVNNQPVRPSKFQAANQIYGYPYTYQRAVYPTIMRRPQGPSYETRRQSNQQVSQQQPQTHQAPHSHAADFHAVNQYNPPPYAHHQQAGRVPCNRPTAKGKRRRPHPTCTVWPAGAGGVGSAGK